MVHFPDHPEFTPDYTPEEIFRAGIMGGSYFRPIHSTVTGEDYHGEEAEFSWSKRIASELLSAPVYDKRKNKFAVKCGTTLEFWESKGWIEPVDPYGWIQWYCRFHAGRRCYDDARQIARWHNVTVRFGRRKNPSPVVRQVLLSWAVAS